MDDSHQCPAAQEANRQFKENRFAAELRKRVDASAGMQAALAGCRRSVFKFEEKDASLTCWLLLTAIVVGSFFDGWMVRDSWPQITDAFRGVWRSL